MILESFETTRTNISDLALNPPTFEVGLPNPEIPPLIQIEITSYLQGLYDQRNYTDFFTNSAWAGLTMPIQKLEFNDDKLDVLKTRIARAYAFRDSTQEDFPVALC